MATMRHIDDDGTRPCGVGGERGCWQRELVEEGQSGELYVRYMSIYRGERVKRWREKMAGRN
jgi:hypothetical protein